MSDALRAASPGMLEMECAAYVEFRCKAAGCARQAYPSIVGAGPNSCILHYSDNKRRMQDGDLVVMDTGGEFEGYATDVTRTFPVNGRFTDEQARIYDAVLEAQEAGIAAVRPGVTIDQVHAAASAVLKERGLIQYFLHGTSHSVGLDVHDSSRRDAPLRAGYVLTVEPGAYIAAKSLGVRIEDVVLVTETGCEVLSKALPKTRAEIERLMQEAGPK
jgi:Xaa-Pro aminopeptidase